MHHERLALRRCVQVDQSLRRVAHHTEPLAPRERRHSLQPQQREPLRAGRGRQEPILEVAAAAQECTRAPGRRGRA
eukprot:2100711-Prymnesium_polylepis.2